MKIFVIVAFVLIAASPACGEYGKEAAYLRQGTEYLGAQDYQRAVKSFGTAARLNPGSVEAYKGLGMACLKLGSDETASNPEMLEKAAEALKVAARLDPGSADIHYYLGLAYLALYDKKGAVEEQEALKGIDPAVAGQLGGHISSYRPPPSYRPEKRDKMPTDFRVPVTIVGNQVYVPVTLSHGDKTVEAMLVLDTGASTTVISTNVAEKLELDLTRMPRVSGRVVGGGIVTGRYAKLDRVSAGPHSRGDIHAAVIPNSGGGFPTDGLLGMDFLRSYKYHIDFKNRVIEWAR